MPKKKDFEWLSFKFRQCLLKRQGRTTASEACVEMGISQPTFSRLIEAMRDEILVVGKGRSTHYALRRKISDVGLTVVVYEIDERGGASPIAELHGIEPKGFYLEAKKPGVTSRFYDDLPYFMEDLKPSGFLGRLIPKRYPDLGAPADIRNWNADHCLKYFVSYGWDLIGNLIFGEKAFQHYLASLTVPQAKVPLRSRSRIFPKLAEEVLAQGPAGSSAAGEQPKFLAVCDDLQGQPILVKFSPPLNNPVGQRWGDLLICEHIAHQVLNQRGMISLESGIIRGGGRLFLQVKRFDRIGFKKRKGIISLYALSLECTGFLGSWTEMGEGLARQKIISPNTQRSIRWLDLFGELIANTDRHGANLSFFTENFHPRKLAPVYDMLPMLYRPEHDQLVERNFEPPLPNPADGPIGSEVLQAALDFWRAVQNHPGISGSFKVIAKNNIEKLERLNELSKVLSVWSLPKTF